MVYYEEKKAELVELLELIRKEKADFENVAKHGKDWLGLQVSEFEKHKEETEKKIEQEKEANIQLVKKGMSELEKRKKEAEDRIAEDNRIVIQLAEEK